MAADDRYKDEGVPADDQREPEELGFHEEEDLFDFDELEELEDLEELEETDPEDGLPADSDSHTVDHIQADLDEDLLVEESPAQGESQVDEDLFADLEELEEEPQELDLALDPMDDVGLEEEELSLADAGDSDMDLFADLEEMPEEEPAEFDLALDPVEEVGLEEEELSLADAEDSDEDLFADLEELEEEPQELDLGLDPMDDVGLEEEEFTLADAEGSDEDLFADLEELPEEEPAEFDLALDPVEEVGLEEEESFLADADGSDEELFADLEEEQGLELEESFDDLLPQETFADLAGDEQVEDLELDPELEVLDSREFDQDLEPEELVEELELEDLEDDVLGGSVLDDDDPSPISPDRPQVNDSGVEEDLYDAPDVGQGESSDFGIELASFTESASGCDAIKDELDILDEIEDFDLDTDSPARPAADLVGAGDDEPLSLAPEEDDLELDVAPLGADAAMFGSLEEGGGEEDEEPSLILEEEVFQDPADEVAFEEEEEPSLVLEEDIFEDLEDLAAADSDDEEPGLVLEEDLFDDLEEAGPIGDEEEPGMILEEDIFEDLDMVQEADGTEQDQGLGLEDDLFHDLAADPAEDLEVDAPEVVEEPTQEEVPGDLAQTLASLAAANAGGDGFESMELGIRPDESEEESSGLHLMEPDEEIEHYPEFTPTLGEEEDEGSSAGKQFLGRQDNLFAYDESGQEQDSTYGESDSVAAAGEEEYRISLEPEESDGELSLKPLEEEEALVEDFDEVDEVYNPQTEQEGDLSFGELYGYGDLGDDQGDQAGDEEQVMVRATGTMAAVGGDGDAPRRSSGFIRVMGRLAIAASVTMVAGAGAYFLLPRMLGTDGGSRPEERTAGDRVLIPKPEHNQVPPPELVPDGKVPVVVPPVDKPEQPKVAQVTPPAIKPVVPPVVPPVVARPPEVPVTKPPVTPKPIPPKVAQVDPPLAKPPVDPGPVEPTGPETPKPPVAQVDPVGPEDPVEPTPADPPTQPKVAQVEPTVPDGPRKPGSGVVLEAPWDTTKVVRGTNVLALLPNGNFLKGKVRKINKYRVQLDYKGGELTFYADEVQRLVPATDQGKENLEENPHKGRVVLKNKGLITGMILLEDKDYVVIKKGTARITIPRDLIAKIDKGLAMGFEVGDTPDEYKAMGLDKPLPEPKVVKPATPVQVDIPTKALDSLRNMLKKKDPLAVPPKVR